MFRLPGSAPSRFTSFARWNTKHVDLAAAGPPPSLLHPSRLIYPSCTFPQPVPLLYSTLLLLFLQLFSPFLLNSWTFSSPIPHFPPYFLRTYSSFPPQLLFFPLPLLLSSPTFLSTFSPAFLRLSSFLPSPILTFSINSSPQFLLHSSYFSSALATYFPHFSPSLVHDFYSVQSPLTVTPFLLLSSIIPSLFL